jgi:hypothetical protein
MNCTFDTFTTYYIVNVNTYCSIYYLFTVLDKGLMMA